MKTPKNTIRIVRTVEDFSPTQHTILGWKIENIEEVVSWLKGNGVVFESYEFIHDREHLIWTAPNGDKVAWFKDPDDNVLSVSQHA
jgi:hypothetical protein